uniref:Two-component system, OmpR family, copper resistance phosphate regulon response regulator CusR n=1 Tax=Acetithermum autotrophicum TaxID=1446466 RepID=H5SQV5_ACEAU|nr:two-component system, OmpR family, copper resistance phosphate regulon response regulator CusR [Candidatus Acetothermum autotrophicum]
MRILVVEDQPELAGFIRQGLTEEHYAVDVAYDGEEALFLTQLHPYDLIILDILLPKKDGLTMLRELRQAGRLTPVLLLTAKDALQEKVHGLDSGADDYLTKPFAFAELLARVRALLRRGSQAQPRLLRVADLTLDLVTHQVQRNGKEIELTGKEYEVLEYFMRHPNRVITRTELSEHVWAGDFDSFSNLIDVFIYRLRRKIDRDSPVKLFRTIRGVGYQLQDPQRCSSC